MLKKTLWATVRQGKIEPIESADLPEGGRVLVALLHEDECEFWQQVSYSSLLDIWDDIEDGIYAHLDVNLMHYPL